MSLADATGMYLWLRLAKLVAVSLFVAGCLGAVLIRDLEERRRFAYLVAGPGVGLTWLTGFGLLALRRISVLSPWILGALFLSLVTINAVLYVVGQPGRRTAASAAFILVPLLLCFWLMVYKPA